MGLKLDQIEHWGWKRHSHKNFKKQRNRKIRRVKKTEIPYIKYRNWEYQNKINMVTQLNWLEQQAVNLQVGGSSPSVSANGEIA